MIKVIARPRPGHRWIFSNELLDPPVSTLVPGAAVDVYEPGGRRIGRGYANPRSLITIRLVTSGHEDLDDAHFWTERLRAVAALRARLIPGRTAGRFCAGDADGMPGVIMDRFGDVLSVQVTTLGMEQRLPLLEVAVNAVFSPTGAVLRNDVAARRLEELPPDPRVWFGEVPERVEFSENGVRYSVDVVHGQKTGFFFDQAENRAFFAPRAGGADVLDAYAHVGGWALTALVHGARAATTIESSAPTNQLIAEGAVANGVADRLTQLHEDAREAMSRLYNEGRRFDLISVDPPAFAKSRKHAGVAVGAYKQVNTAGLRLVRPGGLYFTSSCSHHVLPERFEEAVLAGARTAGRELLLIRRGGQAADHPIHPMMPETAYLKHLVYAVVR